MINASKAHSNFETYENPPGPDLISLLSRRIVGQSAATKAIVPYVYMYQSGLAPDSRPAGVFLLLGPTGTGKTKTVEAIAGLLHGSEKKVLKIDCGEFQMEHENGESLVIKPLEVKPASATDQSTILIVDDNRALLTFLVTELETEGWHMLTAETAGAARQLFAERNPTTVLLDYMLGDDDGLKLALEFQATAPATQFIIMTGGGLGDDELAICEERDFPILYKPFVAEAVLNLIRGQYLRTSVAASS